MKNKIATVFSIILLIVVMLSGLKNEKIVVNHIRVGVGKDMSGFVVDYMIKHMVEASDFEAYFIKDCCAKTSQLALANDLLDIGIICVSAAELFVEVNPEYIIYAPVTMNTDVILTRLERPRIVGITQNRHYQEEIVKDKFGSEIQLASMIPSALPYALEKREIEAALIDVSKAPKMNGSFIGIGEEKDYVSYVLIVHEKFVESKLFDEFVKFYNIAVREINGDQGIYDAHLASYIGQKTVEKGVHQKWKVKLLSIEAN